MADRPGGFEFAASPEALGFDPAGMERQRSIIPEPVRALPNPARQLTFGLGFSVVRDPAAPGAAEVRGTINCSGGWFWIDPENDLVFIGLIQCMADRASAAFRTVSRQLTYEALTDSSGALAKDLT